MTKVHVYECKNGGCKANGKERVITARSAEHKCSSCGEPMTEQNEMSARKRMARSEMKPKPAAFELPDVPTCYNLEVVVMPNGEILCAGKSVGYTSKLGQFLSKKEEQS
jgi:hypothetical protein